MIEPGTTIGSRYRVTRKIGGGGMKVVYQAEDLRLSARLCALAEISDGFVDLNLRRQALDAFQREASLLSQLENPHIPRVYDYFDEANRAFLVMEFVDGKTLERLVQDSGGRLPEEQAVSISVQLAGTLDYLHSRNPPIIYRDLKPSNVIVTPTGLVKLIDFGIARHFQPATNATMIGTPGYAAPEQYRGKPQAASDVYSLAALLHQMVSGRDPNPEPPFSYPSLQTLVPACNATLAELVRQGLEYDVHKRVASAREFRDRLVALKTEIIASVPTANLEPSGSATNFCKEPPNQVSASEASRFCTRCGAPNAVSVATCAKCGNTLRQFYDTRTSERPVAPAAQENMSSKSQSAPRHFMFCRHCGTELSEKAELCVRCGARPRTGDSYCNGCASPSSRGQKICTSCGVRLLEIVRTDFSPLSLYYQSEFAEILSSGEAYKGKFNWAAFLFGVFWALSKGLWLSALVAVVVITLTRGWGAFFFWIWYGFRANYIYYCRFAKDKQKII